MVAETNSWIDSNVAASESDFKKKFKEVRRRKLSIVGKQTKKRNAEAAALEDTN